MTGLFYHPHYKENFLVILGDALIVAISLALGIFLNDFIKEHPVTWDSMKFVFVFISLFALSLLAFYTLGIYEYIIFQGRIKFLITLTMGLLLVIFFYITFTYFIPYLRPARFILAVFAVTAWVLMLTWHLFCRYKTIIPPQRVLIIGVDDTIEEIIRLIENNLVRFYILAERCTDEYFIAHSTELSCIVLEKKIDVIIYSADSPVLKNMAPRLLNLRFKNKVLYDAYGFYQMVMGKLPIYSLDDCWFLLNSKKVGLFSKWNINIKRALDVLVVLMTLPVALPLIATCAFLIKITSKGSVFVIQERLGQNSVPFRLIKLRTMVQNAEQSGPQWARANDSRVTRVGKILRKTGLDELSQIFNVLKGDMSLVGPRPMRKYFTDMLEREIPFYSLRFLAKPGMTGWAQVNCNSARTNGGEIEKLKYELFYLINQSFFLDIFILIRTTKVVFWGKGT